MSMCFIRVQPASLSAIFMAPWLSASRKKFWTGLRTNSKCKHSVYPNTFLTSNSTGQILCFCSCYGCRRLLFLLLLNGSPHSYNEYLDVDFRFVLQPAQSASQYLTDFNLQFYPPELIPWARDPLMSRNTIFTQVRGPKLGFSIICDSCPAAKTKSQRRTNFWKPLSQRLIQTANCFLDLTILRWLFVISKPFWLFYIFIFSDKSPSKKQFFGLCGELTHRCMQQLPKIYSKLKTW